MSAYTSVPVELINDKELKDFDKVLYMIIAQYMNEKGYSNIKNATLAYKTGKKERAIQMSLERLQSRGWLRVKHDVTQNSVYEANYKRVIWLEEFYRKYAHRTRKAKKKTVRNDYKTFIDWLRQDMRDIVIPVIVGGIANKYMIRSGAKDGNMILHVYDRDQDDWVVMNAVDSKDVYKHMWKKKNIILEHALKAGISLSIEKIQELANSKKIGGDEL